MRYWSFVFYTLVWDIFFWSGFSFLIYWHGASKWWYLLALLMTLNTTTNPWKCCCDNEEDTEL